jgi:uncharacterized protein
MTYSAELFLSLCVTAFVAGVVNSVAGGGTLLTFPALLSAFASLGPGQAEVFANATSTLALVPGSAAGAWGYRRNLRQTRRWLILLLGPSLIGGIIGALLMTQFPQTFATLVPWLLLIAAILFLFDTVMPRKNNGSVKPTESQPASSGRGVAGLMFFQLLVSIYGGYFGAGMGILMLSALAMMGVGDIHQMNALKTSLGFVINGVSAVIFVIAGKIDWPFALSMAVTATIGGYLGARLALRIEPRQVRWGIIVIAFGLAGYYFFKQLS